MGGGSSSRTPDTWLLVDCTRCDGTGVEPDPGEKPRVEEEEYLVNDIIPTPETAAYPAAAVLR